MFTQFKKYIKCYIITVSGIIGVILISFITGEISSRLQNEDQILLQITEETATEAAHILKIGAWQKIENTEGIELIDKSIALGDRSSDYQRDFYETTGSKYIFPAEKYIVCGLDENTEVLVGTIKKIYRQLYTVEKENIYFRSYSQYEQERCTLIASADAELEIVLALRNNEIFYGKPPGDFTTAELESTYDGEIKGRDELAVNFSVPKHGIDSTARKECAVIRSEDGSLEQLHYASYYQSLSEICSGLDGKYMTVDREVTEFEVVVSAYDRSNPDKLIARARVLVTSYGAWNFSSALGENYIYARELELLGINTPENYGYTTATLHDYWQLEEW